MTADELRALQAPVKERYRQEPAAAALTMRATGTLGPDLTCAVPGWQHTTVGGLHPAAGGDGKTACAGDMLLEALVACAGVTLKAVATALSIPLRGGTITAEGDMDFRGTLGVSKEVPVGFTAIRLHFQLDTDAPREHVEKLVGLAKRYCVVYQTLAKPPSLSETWS